MSSLTPPQFNPNLFQVFFMSCYCGLPISFARHMWVVVNKKGKISRWEVLIVKGYRGIGWGHLYLDAREPFAPLGLLTIGGKAIFDADFLGKCEGGEGSTAEKMVNLIESSPTSYPNCEKYSLFSPNSNSYVRWVLRQFPEVKLRIPWNTFGK